MPAGDRRRLAGLLGAGLTDSFGLSFGWTVCNLVALARGGLAAAGLLNAAMLAGVVLSAPLAAWLSSRLHGRRLLALTSSVEIALRVATFAALLAGLPDLLVAAGVLVLNAAAWTGFAGMRAEVAAVDGRAAALTRYAVGVAAVEAAGAGLGAVVPLGPGGELHPLAAAGVAAVYGASLLPTLLSARRARVRRGGRARALPVGLPLGGLAGAGAVMALASGPTLLAVALAARLHGHGTVVGAAAAFSAGCLLAPTAVRLSGRLRLPTALSWSLWGAGMLAGWAVAPLHVAGLVWAQLLSGLSLSAFEGVTDAWVTRAVPAGEVTAGLAASAAARALGSAVAVRFLPVLVAAEAVGQLSAALAALLLAAAVLAGAAAAVQRRTRTARPVEAG